MSFTGSDIKGGLMILAERLFIPDNTRAILWDMDGVLLDTLGLDFVVCNQLLQHHFGTHVTLTKEFIRSIFAYHPPEFWQRILNFIADEYHLPESDSRFEQILETYNQARINATFEVLPGIQEILESTGKHSIKNAVVSNNSTEDVHQIISQAKIVDYFDLLVGNDIRRLKKKPEPDTYLFATEQLQLRPDDCVVIEDSLLGAESGHRSGCFTIGAATGGIDFQALTQCQWTNQVYWSFQPNQISMRFGDVTKKKLWTPNDFVSHMIEHIAWRLGCEINLHWNNNNWLQLGKSIGEHIQLFEKQQNSGIALGMIDDGSAEVIIELAEEPDLDIEFLKQADLDWFMALRCEQIHSGTPLVELLKGLSQGLGAKISMRICSIEDPHHTWEGIFRSVGIALNKIYTPTASVQFEGDLQRDVNAGDISVHARSVNYAKVSRGTAESKVVVHVDFSKHAATMCRFNVSSTIQVSRLQELLEIFAEAAGCTIHVDFNMTTLNSSHVVMEDTALVLGRALKEILVLRMMKYGVHGAGSSLQSEEDLHQQPIRVGVSVEGRKFWKFVPFENSFDDVRKRFIIGQNVCDSLFSEDLDDFLDGLAGGLNCSIIIHLKELMNANEGWQIIFRNLGKALQEVFGYNPYRRGVPPGVKATLS